YNHLNGTITEHSKHIFGAIIFYERNSLIEKMFLLMLWVALLILVVLLYFRQTYSKFTVDGVAHFKPVPLLG
ncbi:jg13436, partial [Pararge aegeria aegeria]